MINDILVSLPANNTTCSFLITKQDIRKAINKYFEVPLIAHSGPLAQSERLPCARSGHNI